MNITFFLGRVHHAIKLLPVAVELNNRNHDINFLVADNSINIDPPTEYLHKYGINKFHHTKDFLDSSDIERADNWTRNEIASNRYNFLPWNSPQWVVASLREAAQNICAFDNYLQQNKTHVVFGLHENNFWTKTLFHVAQKQEIRTCSLMEGIVLEREERDMNKYSMATEYTHTLFSWSEYDKEFYSDPLKIMPVGPVHLDEWIRMDSMPDQERGNIKLNLKAGFGLPLDKKLVLFAPPRLDLYQGDPVKAIAVLNEYCSKNGLKLVIKFHPFQGRLDMDKIAPGVSVFYDDDAAPFLAVSDVVITQTSTVSIEAICLGKPVIELDIDYYGIEQPLWKEGAATLIDGDDLSAISEVLDSPPDTTEFKQHRLSLADGESAQRIVSNLEAGFWIK